MLKHVFLSLLFSIFYFNIFASFSVTRHLEDFNSVDVFGNIKVVMVKSDSCILMINSDLYDIAKVSSVVENGKLKIKSAGIGDKNEVFITLYYKEINALSLDASANLIKADTFTTQNFSLKVAKGSLCQAKFNVKILDIIIANGGEARVYGKAEAVTVNCNGGGVFDASKLLVATADLFATSGAKIFAHVSEKMVAKARLGGIINYSGNPKVESIDAAAGGKINKL